MEVVRDAMSEFITKCRNSNIISNKIIPNLAPLINNGGKSLITNDRLSGVNGGDAAGGGGRGSSTNSISSNGEGGEKNGRGGVKARALVAGGRRWGEREAL